MTNENAGGVGVVVSVSPQPAMAAAVVQHQESTTDEAAPIVVVDKDEEQILRCKTASPIGKIITPKKNKQHLEQRLRRRFMWSSMNIAIAVGRLFAKMGVHGAQQNALRKTARLGAGVKRATLPGISHVKAKIRGVKVRVYRPLDAANKDETKKMPVLIFFHGGGWTICSARSYHPFILGLCRDTGVIIVSVDYRLAPEHPYPASLDDCLEVTQAILNADVNPDEVGEELAGRVDVNRVVIGGDSAGGNLSACVGLELIRQNDFRLHALLLICPVVQAFTQQLDSYRKHGKYSTVGFSWFLSNYAGIEPHRRLLRLLEKDRHIPDETRQRFSKYLLNTSCEHQGEQPCINTAQQPDSGCHTASSSVPSPAQTDHSQKELISDEKVVSNGGEATKEETAPPEIKTEEKLPTGGPLVIPVMEATHAEETHVETDKLIEQAPEIPDVITQLATNTRAWPLLAENSELAQMPITMVLVCAEDPLLDEGRIFADRMRQSGAKDVRYFFLPRAQHVEPIFYKMIGSKASKHGYSEIAKFIKEVTASPAVAEETAPETATAVPVTTIIITEEETKIDEPKLAAEPVKAEELNVEDVKVEEEKVADPSTPTVQAVESS